jgi:hypothetical protein
VIHSALHRRATGGRDTVIVALEQLAPLTTRGIAQTLRNARCHGVRGDAEQCPLARYLMQETGIPVQVVQPFASTPLWVVRLPYSVARFADEFDNGKFAALRGMRRRETP